MSYWTYVEGNLSIRNNYTFLNQKDMRKAKNKQLKSIYKLIDKLKETIGDIYGDRQFYFYINRTSTQKEKIDGYIETKEFVSVSISSSLRYEKNEHSRIQRALESFMYNKLIIFERGMFLVEDTNGNHPLVYDKHKLPVYIFNDYDELYSIPYQTNSSYDWGTGELIIDNDIWDVDKIFKKQKEFEQILQKHNIQYVIKNAKYR